MHLLLHHFVRWRRAAFASLSLLAIQATSASEDPAEPTAQLQISSAEAVAIALSQNPSLAAARAAIDAAAAEAAHAGKLDNPEIRLEYTSDSAFSDEGEWSYTIGFKQRFPVTSRLQLLKQVSKLELQLAEAELRNQQRLLISEVEAAVSQVSTLDQRAALLAESSSLQERFAKVLRERIERGEASTLDLNQERIALFTLEQEKRSLKKQREAALGKLRSLLGADAGAAIEILTPEAPTVYSTKSQDPPEGDWENHPEYQFASLLVEIAKGQTALVEAELWQDVAVELFFSEGRSIDAPLGLQQERSVGIGFSLPLPLRDNHRGHVKASLQKERQTSLALSALKLRLQNDAASLRRNAEATQQQLSDYRSGALALAEQTLDQATQAYAEGLVDIGEVFRAREQLLQLKTAEIDLRQEWEQLMIAWHAATGRNLTLHHTPSYFHETHQH